MIGLRNHCSFTLNRHRPMPLAQLDVEAGMNHALILSQTTAEVVQGKIRIILVQGYFTDAELARYYVDTMNFRLTSIPARILVGSHSTLNIRRICGSQRGWPCRNCGSSKAKPHCQCEFTHYCDSTCQRTDWKRHKRECHAIKSQFGLRNGRLQQSGWNHQTYHKGGIVSGYDFDILMHLIRNL